MNPKLITVLLVVFALFFEWRRGYFNGTRPYISSLRLKAYAYPALLLLSLVIVLFFLDHALLRTVQEWKHPVLMRLERLGARMGYSTNPWFFLLSCYTLLLLARKNKPAQTVFACLLAMALSAISGMVMKSTFLRARPNTDLGPLSFFNIDGLIRGENLFQSLPSGDVIVVAGAAFFFFFQTKNALLKLFFACLPLLTAFSRMSENRHWPSDTLTAIGIGLLCAHLVHSYHNRLPKHASA